MTTHISASDSESDDVTN